MQSFQTIATLGNNRRRKNSNNTRRNEVAEAIHNTLRRPADHGKTIPRSWNLSKQTLNWKKNRHWEPNHSRLDQSTWNLDTSVWRRCTRILKFGQYSSKSKVVWNTATWTCEIIREKIITISIALGLTSMKRRRWFPIRIKKSLM